VHGGIVALVCDETMGNLIVLRHGDSAVAVTTSMRLRYFGTVRVGVAHLITARITAADDSVITTSAEVTGPEGDLLATATAGYRLLPVVPLS
jgi:acyl-coenzyme A thioesterase PaaI-like protein